MNVQVQPLAPGEIVPSHELVPSTMRELGNRFPCGSRHHGPLAPFEFRPPNLGTLKAIGELKARGKKDLNTPGKLGCASLVRALTAFDGRDTSQGSEGSHVAALSQFTVGDVLYLGFAWQAEREPEGIEIRDQACGRCGGAFPSIRLDVRTLKVTTRPETVTDAEPLTVRVGLRRGFKLPDGQKVTTLLLRPPSWSETFWALDETGWNNAALLQAWTFKAAICGTDASHDGIRPSITFREIDQLWPEDCRLIDEALSKITPTPELRVEVTCPDCGADSLIGMDWSHPDFFGG